MGQPCELWLRASSSSWRRQRAAAPVATELIGPSMTGGVLPSVCGARKRDGTHRQSHLDFEFNWLHLLVSLLSAGEGAHGAERTTERAHHEIFLARCSCSQRVCHLLQGSCQIAC